MDQHKIENFAKAHPGVAFPTYLHVDHSHASAIRDAIAKSIDSPELKGLALVKRLRAAATEVASLQGDAPAFSIGRLLSERGLKRPEKVYLNWYRFDDIDQIGLADLDRHLSDIWYPGTDDLDVFDDSAAWIVSITHYGKVWLFRR
ncbi:hypothetical protein GCM10023165_45160 [Variovorax defluvii]|uniref:Uncharacterized protein n=1 Tax=Variovorax defluvii TaxID=913761 RepID=A0ABP8I9D0_9BURK